MNALEKLQKKFKNKTQIGGKGTFRRKTKKTSSLSNHKKVVTLVEKRYKKIIDQINNFVNEKIVSSDNYEQFYNYVNEQTTNLFSNFKRKEYLKKKVIEDKKEFIDQYLLNNMNNETLLKVNYKIKEKTFSEQGIDTILNFYYELWDSINKKDYLKY